VGLLPEVRRPPLYPRPDTTPNLEGHYLMLQKGSCYSIFFHIRSALVFFLSFLAPALSHIRFGWDLIGTLRAQTVSLGLALVRHSFAFLWALLILFSFLLIFFKKAMLPARDDHWSYFWYFSSVALTA